MDDKALKGSQFAFNVTAEGVVLPTWSGMHLNVDLSLYTGLVCRYEKPYSHVTKAEEIDEACKGYKYALVGASCKDSRSRLDLGAWGETAQILTQTTSST
mmetsp:Transcript_41085/g.66595  ORF Transcript_41085/g.66595 Transcript_41085/m.66595 type:complete len:100 (+) Transcript_41085:1044-1343(+)